MKICSICKELKPLNAFSKKSSGKDGLCQHCKECEKKRWKKWYVNNSDKVKSNVKWWMDNSEGYREKKKISDKRWKENNKERSKLTGKEWRESNKNKMANLKRKWHKNNPHKGTEYAHARRARKLRNGGDLTAYQIKELKLLNTKCAICGSNKNLVVDHIIPLALGGRNDINNVQILCSFCNSSKGVRIYIKGKGTEQKFLEAARRLEG